MAPSNNEVVKEILGILKSELELLRSTVDEGKATKEVVHSVKERIDLMITQINSYMSDIAKNQVTSDKLQILFNDQEDKISARLKELLKENTSGDVDKLFRTRTDILIEAIKESSSVAEDSCKEFATEIKNYMENLRAIEKPKNWPEAIYFIFSRRWKELLILFLLVAVLVSYGLQLKLGGFEIKRVERPTTIIKTLPKN